MSELREECYKCLNNQNCLSMADYGSVYCMTRRKFKMPEHEDDSVYATKFAAMQKQIDDKDKRIKELENKLKDINAYILTNGIDEHLKTATQIQVENQQHYIFQQKINLLEKRLENSIPRQKVKDIAKQIQEEYDKVQEKFDSIWDKKSKDNYDRYKLQELSAMQQELGFVLGKFEELLEEGD